MKNLSPLFLPSRVERQFSEFNSAGSFLFSFSSDDELTLPSGQSSFKIPFFLRPFLKRGMAYHLVFG